MARSPSVGNLQLELTSFIGRRHELSTAKQLMTATRLLTLTGPGGVGKTRLASRMATDAHRAYRHGVWFVGLADLQQGDFIVQNVAQVLGLRDDSTNPLDQLTEYLRDRQLLLVMDNCEHLVDSAAAVVGKLLSAAPELRVLATSRQALAVEGEQVFPVPPLSLPSSQRYEDISSADAVTLFTERATAANPGFQVTDANREAVVQICDRLEGIPLAIELAAVRLRALSEEEILARLDNALELLKLGPRTMPMRQQKLEATIDWSYRLCSAAECHVWQVVSVCVGGFTVDAVEAMVSDEDTYPESVFDAFYSLVDKSIIARGDDHAGLDSRYYLPEVLRQFGAERLAESGGEDSARIRHRDYYRRIAERGEAVYCSPDDKQWFALAHAEHANIRAALEYSLSKPEEVRVALGMAAQMRPFWSNTGFLLEGYRWLSKALDLDPRLSPERIQALSAATFLALLLAEVDTAQRILDECREIERTHDDEELHAQNAMHSFLMAFYQADLEQALRLGAAAEEVCTSTAKAGVAAEYLAAMSILSFSAGAPNARTHARTLLNMTEENGANLLRALALWIVGLGYWTNSDLRRAENHIQAAVTLYEQFDAQAFTAACFEGLAWCAASMGELERAVTLHGAADRIWLTSRLRIVQIITLVVGDDLRQQTRSQYGDEAWDAAYESGMDLAPTDAIDFALRRKPRKPEQQPGTAAASVLTKREREIARLVGEGYSNKEVAARLVISVRTAEAHLENIFTKLGFRSRTQVVKWVQQNNAVSG